MENVNLKTEILKNPDAKIQFFVGKNDNEIDRKNVIGIVVDDLIEYEGKQYNANDFKNKLYEIMYNAFEDKEILKSHIINIVELINFQKTISVYID